MHDGQRSRHVAARCTESAGSDAGRAARRRCGRCGRSWRGRECRRRDRRAFSQQGQSEGGASRTAMPHLYRHPRRKYRRQRGAREVKCQVRQSRIGVFRSPDAMSSPHVGVRAIEEVRTMTRHANPFAALSELITQAFATLRDRDNPGGQNAFVVFPPRAPSRDLSTAQTSRAGAPSTQHGAQPNVRPNEISASMHRRRHTDPR